MFGFLLNDVGGCSWQFFKMRIKGFLTLRRFVPQSSGKTLRKRKRH